MNERPRKDIRLTISLEEQDYRALTEMAKARDASLSWVVRQAIRHFIETTSGASTGNLQQVNAPGEDR